MLDEIIIDRMGDPLRSSLDGACSRGYSSARWNTVAVESPAAYTGARTFARSINSTDVKGKVVVRLFPRRQLSASEKESILQAGWKAVLKARGRNRGASERE